MGYTKYGTLSKIRLVRDTYITALIQKDVTGTNTKIPITYCNTEPVFQ